ncbi:MAG: efflux RND transporter periplasmic adaptor subunit [Proteobacteria bacterium]|nr:efflux RND transporter periplasmic adaptor subunit [Pseudomonadota bacterium]
MRSLGGLSACRIAPWLAGSVLATSQVWAAGPPADANTARGVLRAESEAVLASSVSERIVKMPFREGDSFKRGDVLVSFDCSHMAAELRAARAGAEVESRNSVVQNELLSMDATGRADADIAKFKEKEKVAQADAIAQRMTGCRLVAPFAGRVVETMVRVNETPAANEKLIRVVSAGPLELHMVVPSKWLTWLKPGSQLAFVVDETGSTLQTKVLRISGAVDAVSQTVKVIAAVPNAPAGVLPGMSGRATLDAAMAGTSASVADAQLTSTRTSPTQSQQLQPPASTERRSK